MKISVLQSVLAEGLQPGNELHDNHMARNLYELLAQREFIVLNMGPDNDSITWNQLANLSRSDGRVPELPVRVQTDFLFKNVLIKGVKKTPDLGHFFRINFSHDDAQRHAPVSNIIMGINGVGKTSFYGALECICMGEMKTAAIHGVDPKEYIKNIFTQDTDISAVLNSSSGKHELNLANLRALCAPAHFISEWDIRELEPLSNFSDFIFAQLGLKNYIDFIDLLEDTILKLQDVRQERLSNIDIAAKVRKLSYLQFYVTKVMPGVVDVDKDVNSKLPALPKLLRNNAVRHDALQVLDKFAISIDEDLANSCFRGNSYFGYLTPVKFINELSNLRQSVYDNLKNPDSFAVDTVKQQIKKANNERTDLNKMRAGFKSEINTLQVRCGNNIEAVVAELLYLQSSVDEYNFKTSSSLLFGVSMEINNIREIQHDLISILNFLNNKLDSLMADWVANVIKPTVGSLLTDYLKDDNAAFDVSYSSSIRKSTDVDREEVKFYSRAISARLTVSPTGNNTENVAGALILPKEYLNTFRFKMFVVSLKIALAFCANQIYNEFWPIVIDDVFNSSDFNNRNRIGDYIGALLSTSIRTAEIPDNRLQLIFFTQDEVIGNSVYRGMRNKSFSCRLQRLHDYRCFEREDVKELDLLRFKDVTTVVESC